MIINLTDIAFIRLRNQQISSQKFKTVKELVNWMGAIQAQEYNQAKWALGVRLPHLTSETIESAFNSGEIIRTHLMRPTWHFVSPDNIHWLLEITAPQIKSTTKSRHRDLELTEPILKKCREVLFKTLEGNLALTREELNEYISAAGIKTDGQRLPHLLMDAEINGIICSGGMKGNKQTYSLLCERVPVKPNLSQDEALAKLAKSYFSSHGPASLPDFIWWSGLPASAARKALEMNKAELYSVSVDHEEYWYAEPLGESLAKTESVFLLPAFDEYLISYKNRDASITADHHKRAIYSNGIFRPVVVVDGQISGIWNRTLKKDKVIIELDHFRPHNSREELLTSQAAEKYGYFSGLKPEIRVNKT
jgi:hypothetical protein